MEATTLCALMLKAKKVFAKEQTFLSFPISPLPYTPRQLDFFDQSTPAALLESAHHRAEFSTVVDAIATGEAWQPTGDTRLSETYDSILDTAELAISTRTGDEEAQFQLARAILRTADEDSDKLIAYRQRRDAYVLAEQRYTAAALTAVNAGENEKLQWSNTTAPLLKRELAELLQAWMFDGFKEEVETAQMQVATLSARSPSLTWAEWRGRCNPDVDSLNDPLDGRSVMPSGFSPSNAIAPEAWRGFSLSPTEVSALLQEAPPAWLTTMLGTATPQATQAISFEFSSAAVVRPWFDPAMFKARFWKFAQDERKLSDGKSPATGECPAYVAALVFARKVRVTDAGLHPTPTPSVPFEGFHFLQAAQLSKAHLLTYILEPATDPDLQQGERSPHVLVKRRLAAEGRPFTTIKAAHAVPLTATQTALRVDGRATFMFTPPPPAAAKSVLSARSMSQFNRMKIMRSADLVALNSQMVLIPNFPVVDITPPAPAPAPVSPSPAASDDTIFVLAFICKSLQQCPNPDIELQW